MRRSIHLIPFLLLFVVTLLLSGCATPLPRPETYSYQSKPIARNTYELPPTGNDIIGENKVIRAVKGDTFDSLSQRYDIGAHELQAANPRINPYRIAIGTKIIIPEEFVLPPPQYRKGIVINVAELRLYYFTPNRTVMTFPVGLGRQGWRTPLGKTYVYRKQTSPTWHVPKTIRDNHFAKTGEEHPRKIGPGPDNPLGDYAIYLHMNGYLIHGTNNPPSVGRLVSSGCIRMHNDDMAELFSKVKRGTPVSIIYYPNKAGWRDGKLYLESHKPIDHQDGLYGNEGSSPEQALEEAMTKRPATINEASFAKAIKKHTGIPTVIGQQS